jgi:hypothetical protein
VERRANRTSDPDGFEKVTKEMARVFGFNPRRLKQFVNVFRLRVMIALSTGVLAPASQGIGGEPPAGGITIQQLGLFKAILMRWSRLASDLVEDPILLDKLLAADAGQENLPAIVARWAEDQELRSTINRDGTYSLLEVDLRPLLTIMPDTYSGNLGARDPEQIRTRLVSPIGSRSVSGRASSDANTSVPTESVGATGATGPTSSVGVSSGIGLASGTGTVR